MQRPKAKQDDLVLQHLDKQLLVYDLVTNKAYSLNTTSAIVFNACDGRTTFAGLKAKHTFTDELIFLALDELKKESLLADDDDAGVRIETFDPLIMLKTITPE